MTPEEIKAYCQANSVRFVDVKFVDLFGLWQHFTRPIHELNDWTDYERSAWRQGWGFDGSSIRGFQKIEESDMLLVPDPETALMDPAIQMPTLSVICNVEDPLTRQPYSRDPRHIAQKAERYLKETGIGDTVYVGPELEFFIFDDVRFNNDQHSAFYSVDSNEGIWNSGRDQGGMNLGYRPRYKEGYFPVSPHDSQTDIRNEMVDVMERCGIQVELHHHEVATAGQGEIDMRFDTLTRMADKSMLYKYIVKNVAKKHGKVATFMPKPLFQDNGSGMHCHLSIWKNGTNLFFDESGYAMTSAMCRSYIAGLIRHGKALMAICAPTTNSYKRLVPGYEAPVNLVYSARNRSAACRIPVVSPDPRQKRVEFRPPDPSANPYLAFAAILMAGLDGIRNGWDPGPALDKTNLFDLSPEDLANIPTVAQSLDGSLRAMEEDHDFLLQGGVFTPDFVETWLAYKYENEVDPVRMRPHPYEFHLYFDA
ncbi:MAG: type I glutamate--ammonia ligase [Burkholderiaceae bacterium]|nr:type I glutamate--ammonia ligase [Chloroflexi bacterium CFX7]MCK6565657.1 type I glutamate--ammonia ligase [Dehalococcoidia bacterium]MCL4232879.1 type I glutamate--ammonia ligase [Dehalococcoidia bacterium]NUP85068.1 type I glutamate--ammonia ligase [Burkholderiaceae bacterium]